MNCLNIFFNEESTKIDKLYVYQSKFMLNADNLRLIKNAIKSLPPNYWILCQIKDMVDKTLAQMKKKI